MTTLTSTAATASTPLSVTRRQRHRSPAAAPRRRVRASSSGDPPRPPGEEFAPLAAVFSRRLAVGVGAASLVAVGANFAGLTSFLLGFSPEIGRGLKLDALYPIKGYTRCLDTANGFEFMYPANWVGDQTLLYRALGREESQRQLDPPPLGDVRKPRPRSVSEPVVAFGPPGSTGELNVSVIVSPVPPDFSIEAFGGPTQVGEAVVKAMTGSRPGAPDVKATLLASKLRQEATGDQSYYELEFTVESVAFRRHNVAVCSARKGRLFTLNAQAPESAWPEHGEEFYVMANSFRVTL